VADQQVPQAGGGGDQGQGVIKVDSIDKQRRSRNMQRIGSKNTAPELLVRRVVRDLGFTGYRIHRKDLPGKPDLAWVGKKLAIFVHGCFWHGHDCREGLRKPKSNQDYWLPKLERNRARDEAHLKVLLEKRWRVLVVWDCELKNELALRHRIRAFLSDETE
jgi:DNA mismatch endonuclease, patch repair protein